MSRPLKTVFLAIALLVAGTAEAYHPMWVAGSYSEMYSHRLGTADFNTDGRPDLVNESGQYVHVLLTNADATLAAPSLIYTGSGLADLIVFDANGDGKRDVILADHVTDSIVVLPSNGDGTFAPAITSALALDPAGITAADFTGDGKIDLLVRSTSGLALALYAGDGTGGFSSLSSRTVTNVPTAAVAGDIDGDGKGDYAVGYGGSAAYEVFFGNGDGTFQPAVVLDATMTGEVRIVLGDLNGDGAREILIPHFEEYRLSVIRNAGGRTFAPAIVYNLSPPGVGYAYPLDLIVGDIDGDGHADVVVALSAPSTLATLTGNGDGTLNAASHSPVRVLSSGGTGPNQIVAGDFSGDGSLDVAVGTSQYVGLRLNVNGDILLSLSATAPTITAGQSASFAVWARPIEETQFARPPLTGTVTLKRDGVEIATVPLSDSGTATIDVPGLPLGTLAMTAHYSGDDSYRPAESMTAQRVVAESSTVTLTNNPATQPVPYGSIPTTTATITSPLPGPLDGKVFGFRDGQPIGYSFGPSAHFNHENLEIGSHSFYAAFEGTAEQPPSTSAVTNIIVRKATTQVSLEDSKHVRYGNYQNILFTMTRETPSGSAPTGQVRVYSSSALVGSASAADSTHVPINLSPGVHYLHAVYEGDGHYEPSRSSLVKYTVFPTEPLTMAAWGNGSRISVAWDYPLSSGNFRVNRWTTSGQWSIVAATTERLAHDNNAVAGVPYTYRVDKMHSFGAILESSNVDLGMIVSFTDDPLPIGGAVKSVHLTEIVAATNVVRAAGGLPPITIDTSSGRVIQATHVVQLRTAINEARVALGAAPVAYTDTVASGLPMRASHIQELRDAIR